MSEAKAKKKLEEISVMWNAKVSAEQILHVFKNSQHKYTNEKLIGIAKQYLKNYFVDGDKLITQLEVFIKKNQKTPYEALIFMLNTGTIIQSPEPQAHQKPQIPVKPSNLQLESKISASKADFDSPNLCSTRLETNHTPDIVVSEIKEKLAQATQQQSTRSSNSFLRKTQSLNTSGGGSIAQSNSKLSPSCSQALNPISTWTFSFGNDDLILPFQMKMPKPIVGLPSAAQERTIIQELLYTLVGVNGSLVVPKLKTVLYETKDDYHTVVNNWIENRSTIVEFDLNEQITDSIRDILKDILPLANYYFQLQHFIENARGSASGQVLQALSETLSKLIDDYYTTIASLEAMHLRHELNLHKLLFYLRPIVQTMETVTKICGKLQENRYRGGNVLTSLHDSISLFSGDTTSQKILIHLTQKAAEPYLEILSLWIFKGIIQDPRNEFFVEDNQDFQNIEKNECYNEFWEKRYILKPEKIPRFLEKQANIILRTGKYLNVARDCGKRISFNNATELKFSHTDEQTYINQIDDAYVFASKALLELIMDDHDLMGHLLSVKRYFLLQQGDFIIEYMDACGNELTKSVDKVIPIRLENLLELTLRLSSAKYDKYQDNLSTMLMPFDVFTQMTKIMKSCGQNEELNESDVVDYDSNLTGIECFCFDYKTSWPISIILNQITISKYQIIFRQLFYLKHVENFLCRVWIANNNAKKFDKRTSEQYRAAFTLRQRMMSAIQNLEYYMMIEVIEPVWHIFMQQMSKAKNFDDVLNYHDDFLDKCLKNCMLTEPDILKCIVKMCTLCIGFCEFIEEAQRHFIDAELSSMLSNEYPSQKDDSSLLYNEEESNQKDSASTETFSEKVTRFDTLFIQQTVALLMKIHELAEKNHSEKYISLIHRINFNNFYSSKLSSSQ